MELIRIKYPHSPESMYCSQIHILMNIETGESLSIERNSQICTKIDKYHYS